MRPLLSIVVPTRNLAHMAMASTRQILSLPAKNIEVIVRDSSDTAVLGEQLRVIGDSRLVYEHCAPVSMTDNWNRAVELASGEYVCFIGHDDGVNSALVRIVEWASSVGADAVVFPYSAVFYWPDFPVERRAGRLFLGKCSGQIRSIPAKQELIRYIRNSEPITLPRIYHGVVRRACLEALRRKTGQYFYTPAADDYFSYALSTMIENYYLVDFPATIAGKCRGSNSGSFAIRGDGSVHLSRYTAEEKVFDRRSPPTAKTESFKIHALVKALEYCEAPELIDTMMDGERYAAWYALSLKTGFSDSLRILRHLWSEALRDREFGAKARVSGRVARQFSSLAVRKLYRHLVEEMGGNSLMISGSDRQSVHPARDIEEAAKVLERELDKQGMANRWRDIGAGPESPRTRGRREIAEEDAPGLL